MAADRGRVRIQVSYLCGPATYRAGWGYTVPVPETVGREWAEWVFYRMRTLVSRWATLAQPAQEQTVPSDMRMA